MAHVAKYTRGAIKGLTNHWERKTENHSNKEIDRELTYLNYDLCKKDGDTLSRLRERLDEVYCLNRKDVNVCADWIVTLPKTLLKTSDDKQKDFFKSTYNFLEKRYGEKNVISANVHNDETTPHMHFAFVPVVWDEKKQREKVSAKEVLTRKDLQSFHQDLDNHLKREIPHIYQEGIINGKTIGVDTVHDLKKHSEEIQEIKKEMVKDLKAFKEPQKILEDVLNNTEVKKAGLFSKEELVQMSPKNLRRMETLALSGMKLAERFSVYQKNTDSKISTLDQQVNNFADLYQKEKNKNKYLRNVNDELEKKNSELEITNQDLKNNIKEYAAKYVDVKYKQMEKEKNEAIYDANYYKDRAYEMAESTTELEQDLKLLKNKSENLEVELFETKDKLKSVENERDLWKNKFEYLWESTKEYLREYIPNEMSEMIGTIKQWFKSDTGDHIEPESKKSRQRERDDGMSL